MILRSDDRDACPVAAGLLTAMSGASLRNTCASEPTALRQVNLCSLDASDRLLVPLEVICRTTNSSRSTHSNSRGKSGTTKNSGGRFSARISSTDPETRGRGSAGPLPGRSRESYIILTRAVTACMFFEGKLVTHKGTFGPGTFVWFPEGEIMEHAASLEAGTVHFITNKSFRIDYVT